MNSEAQAWFSLSQTQRRLQGIDYCNWFAAQETSECIDWPFKVRPNGYGVVADKRKSSYPHRMVCRIAHGEPFPGAQAAHSCGNRLCVNPKHLRWATRFENEADKILHGTLLRGSANARSKLTEDKVIDIRRRLSSGETPYAIADTYNVSFATVYDIKSGRRWSWL